MTVMDDIIAPDRFDAVAVALDRGRTDRAAALLADLRLNEGPSARLFELEARLEFDQGRVEEARRLLERARAFDPDSSGLRRDLARVHLARALPS